MLSKNGALAQEQENEAFWKQVSQGKGVWATEGCQQPKAILSYGKCGNRKGRVELLHYSKSDLSSPDLTGTWILLHAGNKESNLMTELLMNGLAEFSWLGLFFPAGAVVGTWSQILGWHNWPQKDISVQSTKDGGRLLANCNKHKNMLEVEKIQL